MKKKKLVKFTDQEFYSFWEDEKPRDLKAYELIVSKFKPYIKNISRYVHGEYYWHIFENSTPTPKILMIGGAVEKLTPVDKQTLLKTPPKDFFNFFHPDDAEATFAFLVSMFEILSTIPISEHKYINSTIYLRIKNREGNYVWNSMQYPYIYFENNKVKSFQYAMVLYTNVNHLASTLTKPMLSILNSNPNKEQELTIYYTADLKRVSKIPNTSNREKEIISLLSQGKSSKQISDYLGIAKNTVDNHRQRLLKKFNVTSSSQLVSLFVIGE